MYRYPNPAAAPRYADGVAQRSCGIPSHVVAEGGWDHHDGFAFRMRYVAIFEHATADFDLTRDPQLLLCRDGKSQPLNFPPLSGYDVQARHLLEVIGSGKHKTIATLQDAAAVARILDLERESVLGALEN
jgi:hypothetical protein